MDFHLELFYTQSFNEAWLIFSNVFLRTLGKSSGANKEEVYITFYHEKYY